MKKRKKDLKFNSLKRTPARKKTLQKAFKEVLSSCNFILGNQVEKFEKEFAKYLGVRYCIGVGNGQEALQISLMTLGIRQGDEVITTPVSAVATTLAILSTSAKPVFVDTRDDGLINSELITSAITKKTRAILPVHLYGNPVDLEKIISICKKYKFFLIEDACQAHGSSWKRKKLGTFGDFGCFSFYPTKNLGGFGDGGAIVTNSSKLAQICREIRDYGQKGQYKHVRYGLNSRLDEIQAALLSEGLKNLDTDNKKRRELAERYIKNLKGIPRVDSICHSEPELVEGEESNYHLFVIKIKTRHKMQDFLANHGIQTLIHYPKTIPDQPFLIKEYGSVNIPVARKFVKQALSLPCHPQMSLKDVDYVCWKIKEFYYHK